MPRFIVIRGKNGLAMTQSVTPPQPRSGPVSARKIDEALSSKPLETVPSQRRRIVREGGEVRVVGGPGPTQPKGFDDFVPDSGADLEDENTGIGGEEPNPDATETSDIDEANARVAALKAEIAGESAPIETHPCSEPGCGFEAVTLAGLSSHRRAKHAA